VSLWAADLNAGWPADSPSNGTYAATAESLLTYHSSLALPTDEAPAPTLYANGWSDDIFPVMEELAWVNRQLAAHRHATIAMFLSDVGHPRDQSKATDVNRLRAARFAWFAHYLQGKRIPVLHGVEALTTTCPSSQSSDGPHFATSWPTMHPGEMRFSSGAVQTVSSSSGSSTVNAEFDPIAGPGVCATASAATVDGTATYSFRVPSGGFTMIGSPTVVATLTTTPAPGYPDPSLAAHLLDVAPGGETETLIARATYRPTASGRQVFQLYPQAWHLAPGHLIKLELAGQDAPYSEPNSTPGTVAVSNLQLRLPTLERPNCTTIFPPAAPVVPAGEHLARGVQAGALGRCSMTSHRSAHRVLTPRAQEEKG
jgi:hypothetical protein